MNDCKYALEIMNQEFSNKFISPEIMYAFVTCIEALEKQIPKKPINHYDCHWLCPICNELICDNSYGVEEEYKFCNKCGQAIDWSVEE